MRPFVVRWVGDFFWSLWAEVLFKNFTESMLKCMWHWIIWSMLIWCIKQMKVLVSPSPSYFLPPFVHHAYMFPINTTKSVRPLSSLLCIQLCPRAGAHLSALITLTPRGNLRVSGQLKWVIFALGKQANSKQKSPQSTFLLTGRWQDSSLIHLCSTITPFTVVYNQFFSQILPNYFSQVNWNSKSIKMLTQCPCELR